jgi:hypothetical protein
MRKAAIALTITLLVSLCGATTLVVFYDPVNGAIIATDSSIASGDARQYQASRLTKFSAGCKIDRCGKYWVASAVLDVTRREDIAGICTTVGSADDIDAATKAIERAGVQLAARFVNDLVSRNQPPKVNQHMFSLAVAGYNGAPILRYREVRYTGQNGTANFKATKKVACPGDKDCRELRVITGLFSAIEAKGRNGHKPTTRDPVRLAEELVQIEIAAHKKDSMVMPPVSVLQLKDGTPQWPQRGLCGK